MIVLLLDIICEETNEIVYGFSIGIIHSFSENSDKCKLGGRKKWNDSNYFEIYTNVVTCQGLSQSSGMGNAPNHAPITLHIAE